MKLATIGYEGFEQSDFLNVLRDADVETLVDVRELPLSRKKGFEKDAGTGGVSGRDAIYPLEGFRNTGRYAPCLPGGWRLAGFQPGLPGPPRYAGTGTG